jgi:phosphatidate phosphatase LPIN
MKIGEAGEAFFVFETEDDIPENLITSPILQPTRPDESDAGDADASQSSTGQDPALKQDLDPTEQHLEHGRPEASAQQEPEFLDLNAPPSPPEEARTSHNVNTTPTQTFQRLSSLPRSSSQSTLKRPHILPSPPPTPKPQPEGYNLEMQFQDHQVDKALEAIKKELHVPEVEYHHGE